jgi:hypothetical protein
MGSKAMKQKTPSGGLPDALDLSKLRLGQDFAASAGVKKLLLTVPVRKPHKQEFVRVHPDPDYRLTPAAIIELREDREIYLVTAEMASVIPDELAPATLYTAITRQGTVFLWPVRQPGLDGKSNEWHRSAAEAAERAMQRWVRVMANMSLGAYEVFEATGSLSEPSWPDLPFEQLLEVAFRERIVDRPDHPLIERLRGTS